MATHSPKPDFMAPGKKIAVRRSAQPALLNVESAQLSDRGRVREGNEDYLGSAVPATTEGARTHGWLFALADGVGGHENGEIASRTAIETLVAGFRTAPPDQPLPALLSWLIHAANSQVYEIGHSIRAHGLAMATTVVACALRFDRAVVAHVGDSRCYLVRRGQAHLLTRDHTVAGEQMRMGVLSKKEARVAETRHLLSRSLGTELFVAVDTCEQLLLTGDILLLCSDGLHAAIPDAELGRLVAGHANLNAAAQELVAIANHRDGSDNVSIQLIRVLGVERVGMYRGRPYKLR